jgi:hypothetical protein
MLLTTTKTMHSGHIQGNLVIAGQKPSPGNIYLLSRASSSVFVYIYGMVTAAARLYLCNFELKQEFVAERIK